MVHTRSYEAGKIYDSFRGDAQQLQDRLSGIRDPIWEHDLEKELTMALERLRNDNVFV
jgi:hypothetical protein